jgi:hypothetical protein
MAKRFGKIAIATTTFALATLVSIDWAEQGGVSLSIESAQARVGRPLTPVSVAGVGRRQYRRAAYGYGYGAGAVGVGLAAGAVTAAAVAATSPWGYQSMAYDNGQPYVANTGGQGGYYASSAWGYHECTQPQLYQCQPNSNLGWYR